jgi:8-oxo-dGTP pyrophosphatase MutT (NUDIX family)
MQGASIAFIKNERGHLLIVKPNYLGTDDWSLPGGVIEEGESPIEACKRECLEELGIHITVVSYFRNSKHLHCKWKNWTTLFSNLCQKR